MVGEAFFSFNTFRLEAEADTTRIVLLDPFHHKTVSGATQRNRKHTLQRMHRAPRRGPLHESMPAFTRASCPVTLGRGFGLKLKLTLEGSDSTGRLTF